MFRICRLNNCGLTDDGLCVICETLRNNSPGMTWLEYVNFFLCTLCCCLMERSTLSLIASFSNTVLLTVSVKYNLHFVIANLTAEIITKLGPNTRLHNRVLFGARRFKDIYI